MQEKPIYNIRIKKNLLFFLFCNAHQQMHHQIFNVIMQNSEDFLDNCNKKKKGFLFTTRYTLQTVTTCIQGQVFHAKSHKNVYLLLILIKFIMSILNKKNVMYIFRFILKLNLDINPKFTG